MLQQHSINLTFYEKFIPKISFVAFYFSVEGPLLKKQRAQTLNIILFKLFTVLMVILIKKTYFIKLNF